MKSKSTFPARLYRKIWAFFVLVLTKKCKAVIMCNHFKGEHIVSFIIPSTYEDASSAVHKIHYIFNLIIRSAKIKMYAPLVTNNRNEEIFISTDKIIFPYFNEDRLWFIHLAALQKYKMSIRNNLVIPLYHPDIGEDEYFQYSTVHRHEDIFVAMLIAKLNTVDLEYHKYNNKSCKIIIPAFIALYDYVVHNKKDDTYAFNEEYLDFFKDNI